LFQVEKPHARLTHNARIPSIAICNQAVLCSPGNCPCFNFLRACVALHGRLGAQEARVTLKQFLGKQFIDVIQWTEAEDGLLAYRYPMLDMEIQNGGQLTVRESQMAAFVNEGKIADIFGPGLHTLITRNLPLLTDLKNWDKEFESPFKSDVYFFSTRLQIDQKWGTATPITIRDKEFGAVRLRGYGIYSYRISDPRTFFLQISGTRETYYVSDLEGQLRETIVARMTDIFANSAVSFLDMAANQAALGLKIADQVKPAFAALGLDLTQFVVESISLPDELQKVMDQRIGVSMAGDLGRYTQFEVAQALPVAAANSGGAAGMGVGLGAGVAMGQTIVENVRPESVRQSGAPAASVAAGAKFCLECGKQIPGGAKFCPDCGKAQ
jgi:membrane protease subunit (stomatin/prohibitin family)